MAEAIVSDKFTFANGDTGVVLAMQSGDFASSDFVLVSRMGKTIGQTIIFPRDGSTSGAKAKGTPPQALVKGVTCELGDKIESR
ncbi:hypothetical protein IRT45_01305 [Nocardia sp. BSTN01]|uniref:hypothetical protein n=1 Tax=Nocardia sp. BSTN01 TaxID=2783665 RepID=UPI00188E6CA0|nr:hypothetical protein [Nocardia sp. BSTN01]MBF4995789.1 hypothetical protein [Nocardia sp. BSTN01]